MTERRACVTLSFGVSVLVFLVGCVSKIENWKSFDDCTQNQCEPPAKNQGGTGNASTTTRKPKGGAGSKSSSGGSTSTGGQSSSGGSTSTGGQSSSGGNSIVATPATTVALTPTDHRNTITVGRHFTCGIRNRNLACWGTNDTLQLGNNATWPNDSITPLPLELGNIPNIPADFVPIELAAGTTHACARSNQGIVVCWGDKDHVGTGTLPVRIALNADAKADEPLEVGAGFDHSCIRLQTSGEVWCWGKNEYYQLGWSPPTDAVEVGSLEPVRVNLNWEENGARQISLGLQYTCALRVDSTVWCWGRNDAYQLGHTASISPTKIEKVAFPTEADQMVQISAGKLVACARNRIGKVYCWGDNTYGQLSAAPEAAKNWPVPQLVELPAPAVDVRAGWQHSCALLTDGTVWCWGGNNLSCLGFPEDETDKDHSTRRYWPVQVLFANGPQIVELAVGETHSCIRREDGGVHCWGATEVACGGTNLALAKPLP